ncbi:hypothetical protein LTR36_006829 [Oleoguttula mirabilis]|uniref:Exonuclease 1 n=1 Tax=Oleoguttula mirabilis TaxID=1507867 RepID=A0AAV9JC56_9PEZI|nr:hypothetical protein LTR36_006829 [Oleoguttula mirabilis]
MGIQGLLPLLKSIQKPTHLKAFAGQTLGVDAYGWLHRGTVACAIELAQQKPTRKHIEFTLNRVRMLIHFGVKPFIVFDGDYLPSKAHTEKERAARRKESKRLGLELLRMGRVSQAHLELQKAVDVTPLMARELIEELKLLDVPYIVAPYEADSQLAYLEKQGVISGIISEDSDLLVFGAKCLLTKLDQHGECVMINRADFTACREVSLVGWTDKEFRMMTMLSGCDYLPGIDKMGLKTAYRLVRKHKVIERVVRTVQFDGKMKVPAGYVDSFTRAERTFMHQWVFCPEAQCLVNLNKVPAEVDLADMPYLGKCVEPAVAAGVASGDLDPNTKQRLIVASRHQHQTPRMRTVQTPDEKQGKPISEFFKPRRTPLAELDPNSFTPSPSQQRLLEAQPTTSWSASQAAPARVPALDRLNSRTVPSSAPHMSTRSVSDQRPLQRTSPKRQRLCSDSMLAASMDGSVGLQTATSRFFSKQSTQQSPSLRKASSQKKEDEFQLWSDDSVAEAAAALSATPVAPVIEHAPSPRKRKKLAVFADPAATDMQPSQASPVISQSTTLTGATISSQEIGDETDTPGTSFESAETPSQHTVFTAGINAEFADLKRWAFKSTPRRQGVSRSKSTPLETQGPLHEKLTRSAPWPTEQDCNIEVPSSSPILAHGRQDVAEDGIDGEDWFAIERQHVVPDALLATKGSEDMLVPDSPGSDADDARRRPTIDLGRFAFAG